MSIFEFYSRGQKMILLTSVPRIFNKFFMISFKLRKNLIKNVTKFGLYQGMIIEYQGMIIENQVTN